MFLVLDNYDSFVHNLARYFEVEGEACEIIRSDKITLDEIKTKEPKALVLSPGPCTPKEAGICVEAVEEFGANLPILGVCLGHQAIGEAYGAKTSKAEEPVHGKATTIEHNRQGIFKGTPSPMDVGRYHSLIVEPPPKATFNITAKTPDGEIMAVQHKKHPVYGLQFHPESILTSHGAMLIENFISIVYTWHKGNNSA